MTSQQLMFLLVLFVLLSCKKADEKTSFAGPDSVQGKPDKTSEEPIGLPGYPLICQWQTLPTQDSPSVATVDCFFSRDRREPVTLNPAPVWSVAYQGTATVTTSLLPPIVRIDVKASASSEVMKAVQDMKIQAQAQGVTVQATGREALQPGPGQWRLGSACGASFTLTTVDAQGGFISTTVARFEGCETLAQRLMNLVIPDAALRTLPDTHRTLLGSCDNQLFTLATTDGRSILSTSFNAEACQDLRALVNNLGL